MRKEKPRKGAVSAALYTVAALAVCASLYFLPLRLKPAAVEYPERNTPAETDRHPLSGEFVERVHNSRDVRLYEMESDSGDELKYIVRADGAEGEMHLTLYISGGRARGFMLKAQIPREPDGPGEKPSEIEKDLYRRRMKRYRAQCGAIAGIFEAFSLALDSGGHISPDELADWRFLLDEALLSGTGKEKKGREYRFSIRFFERSGHFELYLISSG